MERHRILVIDDQIGQNDSPEQKSFLRAIGYYNPSGGTNPVDNYPYEFEFHTGQGSVEAVKDAVRLCWPDNRGNRWALVLLDVSFGEKPELGFTLLKSLRFDSTLKDLPIVMLTSEDLVKNETANRLSADGFFPKATGDGIPLWSREGLDERILKCGLIPDDRTDVQLQATGTKRLLGTSVAMLTALREARKYALNPVGSRILSGESGTGKTQLAGYIHWYSRRTGQYVHWYADPSNSELMKGELFGRWKYAYTGAGPPGAGKIEEAHCGTFFLDEVANLPSETQAAFLQFRQTDEKGQRILSRMGNFPTSRGDIAEAEASMNGSRRADHRIGVDVLLLTGTNVNLEDPKIRKEIHFRDDLYYDLGSPLWCPELNKRREDIALLFDALVRQFWLQTGREEKDIAIDGDVLALLKDPDRDWSQGNIRYLEQIAQYGVQQLGKGFTKITINNLPENIRGNRTRLKGPFAVRPEPLSNLPRSVIASGALARAELDHLRLRAQLLEEAAEETRSLNHATGVKDGEYSPTLVVVRLMGRDGIEPTYAKRIIKDILGSILQPSSYLKKAYGEQEIEELQTWVRSKPVLLALYSYGKGEISARDIHHKVVQYQSV